MVGDRDKMLEEDRLQFKDIYVYDWVASMMKELKMLAEAGVYKRNTEKLLESFTRRLCSSIPSYALHPVRGVDAMMKNITATILSSNKNGLDKAIKKVECRLKEMERGIQSVLLNKANIIFCTLSSAGASIVKRSGSVEGLIIDEAAAAVEPEAYVPIAGSNPWRVMIVGDPRQLPATVLSPNAKTFGLDKSLLERLMSDENHPYTMLHIQYRMRPEISMYPSLKFYHGKI